MTLSMPRIRHYLRECNLEKLFIEELGWDRHATQLTVAVDGHTYTLSAIAEKRGVQIFECQTDAASSIPGYATRRKLETQITKSAYEHLIIFVDAARTMQIWQWVARQPGQPTAYREHHYHAQHQSGDVLIQKLEAITFSLNEEESITLTGVVFRLRDAFDRDRFEKYINQKQMGAYYTKEDITEYIAKNTLIPYLFDAAQKKCAIAFQPDSALWRLLRDDPDRYIYEPVRKGVDVPLPAEIARGMPDVNQRDGWNRPAASAFALPTETWREHVSRRQRCQELRDKLLAGEVHQINDLITYNLDLRQFAEDVISNCEGPELLRALYQAISTVTVLDPTCGSGAFLFAALNILEPLYEACLERMQAFVDDLEHSGERRHPGRFVDFRRILAEVDKHPNRRYFILKSIMVNNLYGVDIMEETVEICKLRLFLKLVAQVDRVKDLEPLPDIDFNIRSGNTLVGFVSVDEIRRAAKSDATGQEQLVFGETEKAIRRIEEEAEIVERAFQRFHDMQTDYGMDARDFATAKQELRSRLKQLADELDRYLAGEYGLDLGKTVAYGQWQKSHQPFHWFAEFYGIIQQGGFGVVIGNPPYIELKAVSDYRTVGYDCEKAGNLYALVIERCSSIVHTYGRQGFIVPVSSVSTDRYESLQRLLTSRDLWYISFDDRPSRLFDGLEHIRLTIHLAGHNASNPLLFSTRYNKWHAVERITLFDQMQLAPSRHILVSNSLPKLTSVLEIGIIEKLMAQKHCLASFYARNGQYLVFYSRKVGYFLQVLDFAPKVLDGRNRQRPPSEFKELQFPNETYAQLALCCLNSNLFYWFITVFSDCRHVNKREVDAFPIDLVSLSKEKVQRHLMSLGERLMAALSANSVERRMKFSHDTLTVQCLIPKLSKAIIDDIDSALAEHYGFTDEELDFIINYDVKYRMGQDDDGEQGA